MMYLIPIAISIVLFIAFFVLTCYESRRGGRFFTPMRERLDETIGRLGFILTHVDFAAFLRDETRHLISRAGHAAAHLSLRAVRSVERVLTRLVRYLRMHHTIDMRPGENTREFVRTLSDFKDSLKETRPEVPTIL
ncbi:hypothetical protein A3G63_00300 [Candidatus Kaiserbacteria bacterium RIFCSPLOWO2_12_FULL_52_8]|nr:MAG: hypothetical protein A3G63_00300 [Candidatus Kaiserbacteria bacterium RIFCSPLOWO2_12_FULL_52_8]